MFIEVIPQRLGLGSNPLDTEPWKSVNFAPVVTEGCKKLVLCIGGFGMSASDTYRFAQEYIAKVPGVAVTVLDLPGTGSYSEYQSNDMDIFNEWLYSSVICAVRNAGIEELLIVAFSMSATLIASQDSTDLLKALLPCKLKGVVLLSPSIRYRSTSLVKTTRALSIVESLISSLKPITKRIWFRMPENKSVASGTSTPAFHVWAPLYPLVTLSRWQHRLTNGIANSIFGKVPVFVIQGVRDGKCDVNASKRWAKSLRTPSVKCWWVDDSGHAVLLGRNGEVVSRVIANWCHEQLVAMLNTANESIE
jgi:pimeloyl-ACP methyl ester carboxylesterase